MDPVLQRIGAAVTPAVMVSACGLLALGLDNQAARMTTRIRELARELRAHQGATPRKEAAQGEISILIRRHTFYGRALLANYAALLLFVLTSAVALTQGITQWADVVPMVTFAGGVLALFLVAVWALLAIQLSGAAIALEVRDVVPPS